MKLILPIFLLAVLTSCGPSRNIQTRCPKGVGIAIDTIPFELPRSEYTLEVKESAYLRPPVDNEDVVKPDTVPEWMHVSMRDVGFVVARKALSVRIDGICQQHLDCSG